VSQSPVALETPVRARSAASDARLIAAVCAGHTLSHFYSLVLPPLFPVLRGELGVSYAALGMLITASAGASASSQLVSGFLVDRFGARRILAGGLLLLAGAIALAGMAPSYGVLIAIMAVPGSATASSIRRLFDLQRQGRSAAARPRVQRAQARPASLGWVLARWWSGR
jgi:MFS family permease